jgi:hypothetical protein
VTLEHEPLVVDLIAAGEIAPEDGLLWVVNTSPPTASGRAA